MHPNSQAGSRTRLEYACKTPEEMGWPIDYERRLRKEAVAAAAAFIFGSL